MTYVLSLTANGAPYTDECCGRSCSSISSFGSCGTVQHSKPRRRSAGSFASTTSRLSPPLPLARSTSTFNLVPQRLRKHHAGEIRSASVSRHTSLSSLLSNKVRLDEPAQSCEQGSLAVLEENDVFEDASAPYGDVTLKDIATAPYPVSRAESETQPKSFGRWMSTLRRRRHARPPVVTPRAERWTLDDFDPPPRPPISPISRLRSKHRRSTSSTSSRFITAIKSATVTLASTSIAPLSRRSSRVRCFEHGSSISGPRQSIETQRSVVDEAAKQRARKRRRVLQELLSTEEGYVADLRALSNAYFTIVGDLPTATGFARPTAKDAVQRILHVHKKLLTSLHLATGIPIDDTQLSGRALDRPHLLPKGHARWHSVDAAPATHPSRSDTLRRIRPSLNVRRIPDDETSARGCGPEPVQAAAKIFADLLSQENLESYRNYGANFCLMQQDLDEIERQREGTWDKYYDKGIEVLSMQLFSNHNRQANSKRALTLKSLLSKPIQRLPRYVLLFQELVKVTPVYDDPRTYAILEKLTIQLQTACRSIDEAKSSPRALRVLEITWLLGDRLTFADQVPRTVFLQLLGRVLLCGCLHMTFYGKRRIKGRYVACILYETRLLLAAVDPEDGTLRIQLCVDICKATTAECDNGRGLQCHTTPFSWKLLFEIGGDMYEIILSACSAKEAEVWRQHIEARITLQSEEGLHKAQLPLASPLKENMKSVGKAFGRPTSFVRRMAIERSATVGASSDFNQVTIKNTWNKDPNDATSLTLQIPRSQSVATASHPQILAPARDERRSIETALYDVWTRHLLPYPGMKMGRGDRIRAPAIQMARKFSMTSIASNFSSSKRSGSYTSMSSSRKEDTQPPRVLQKHQRPQLVDLLPADFDLQDRTAKKRKSSTLRTFTMNIERPFSPLLSGESRQSELRRTQSVRDDDLGCAIRAVGASSKETLVAANEPMKMPKQPKSRSKLWELFR